jgi:NDP-sugar pyrophosphorylase family protein
MAEISLFFDLKNFTHAALFEKCTYPWEALASLSSYIKKQKLGKIETEIPEGVFLTNASEISIGEGTVIEPGVSIQGPCVIGKNCVVRQGAYLRGNIITGDGCVLGHASEIKHAIFFNESAAPHFNYVGDSILGNRVNLGAGVVCANLRLDHALIHVHFEGKKIPTSLKKLGAIIGDGAQVGCHCVINPGTLLGKNCRCFPCLNIHGYVPAAATVKRPH